MNKEELIGKLQMVYVVDKNALNEIIDYYDELFGRLCQLEHNWNELKKWLEEKINTIDIVYLGRNKKNYSEDMVLDMSSRKWSYKDSLNKMQELEEGGNNDC